MHEGGGPAFGPLKARPCFLLALALLAVGICTAITDAPFGSTRGAVGWTLVAGVACLLLFFAANQPDPQE
jgi:hypothetical protein